MTTSASRNPRDRNEKDSMLIGIDPLLGGDLLKLLDEMGHGDQIAVVDCNYPAVSSGRPVVQLGDVTVARAIGAILRVIPLDTFIRCPLERMAADTDEPTAGQQDVLKLARRVHSADLEFAVVSRLDFYDRTRTVHAVVRTLDARPYNCFILHKGVIESEAG
jgi:L-fucose mutarotase